MRAIVLGGKLNKCISLSDGIQLLIKYWFLNADQESTKSTVSCGVILKKISVNHVRNSCDPILPDLVAIV